MEKDFDRGLELPGVGRTSSRKQNKRVWLVLAAFVLSAIYLPISLPLLSGRDSKAYVQVPSNAADILGKCRALSMKPGPPPGFNERTESDRYERGTGPILIRNATIWTGMNNGTDIVHGDILLENGLIKNVGDVGTLLNDLKDNITVIDASGAWVTPGIVDSHSHIGVRPSPQLQGSQDSNSLKGIAVPWIRAVDGLHTQDDGYIQAIAGGVTTSLILPSSNNAIGGQAFSIKMRSTSEKSTSSLLVDPPYGLNGTQVNYDVPPRWRHMKHACGENPGEINSASRLDLVWAYRNAYDQARQIKNQQDVYCSKAENGEWDGLGQFPESLQWEALIDVLRGKVKVHTHCHEAVDLDAFLRMSNEFKFPVAAIHHASEAYLVPGLLKRAYEHPPAIALYATMARFKREVYRQSEFAPRILHEEGIKVIMKSDHSAVRSRWLLHEAQQAYYYGLPADATLASVTTNAAELLGLDHRLGYIKKGYDADIVIWDSHPLFLGATPVQVFIDGIPQLERSFTKKKEDRQIAPITPNFDIEAKAVVEFNGLPPLKAGSITSGVLFRNVSSMWQRDESGVHSVFQTLNGDDENVVLVEDGKIICSGVLGTCSSLIDICNVTTIDLKGGSITPALVSGGSALGLQEIALEPSTSDGNVLDILQGPLPTALGDGSIIRAVDGLMFGTRDAQVAYWSGVSTAITSPISTGLLGGLGTYFSLGAKNKLEDGAVLNNVTSVYVAVLHQSKGPGISSQIAALRRLLLGPYNGDRGSSFQSVVKGELPLVVSVKSADVIASLLKLKKEVESVSGTPMRMTLVDGGEAGLVATEIAAANVGVIVMPPRPFAFYWEGRRIIQGPPLTEHDLVTTLFKHGVTVGIGHQGVFEDVRLFNWAARNMRWDTALIHLNSNGLIGVGDALNMATTNIEKLLGASQNGSDNDMVATKGGGLLSLEGKVVAMVSPKRKVVDLFE